jgi:ACS family glucarate transporter-like MFS transporter
MSKPVFPYRYLLAFLTFLLTVLLYVDRACISTAKTDICNDLNLSIKQFGWIMAVFTLGYALLQTPSGIMADRKGPRFVISLIVTIWSGLTALTGYAWNYISILVIRFLFGAGEAGAFPALSKVVYNWYPVKERGIIQGINFSGSRIGAAFAMPLVAWMITEIGWRHSFLVFGIIGIAFGIFWYFVFRDKPEESGFVGNAEKAHIIATRQQSSKNGDPGKLTMNKLFSSSNVWMAMAQYICSNFTFYFTLTWMFPFIKEKFAMNPVEAGMYASIPLFAGAAGNWFSGIIVDAIYRKGNMKLSRRLPSIIGFLLAAFGMVMVTLSDSSSSSIIFLALAVFGADMTLSPSWAFCIDIGKENAGVVSGTMNMAGNLGAFITIIAYPYLFSWTGSNLPFFYICAGLSIFAIFMWSMMRPEKAIISE